MRKFFSVMACAIMLALIPSGAFAANGKADTAPVLTADGDKSLSESGAVVKALSEKLPDSKMPSADKVKSIIAKDGSLVIESDAGALAVGLTADQKAIVRKTCEEMKDNKTAQKLMADLAAPAPK